MNKIGVKGLNGLTLGLNGALNGLKLRVPILIIVLPLQSLRPA